MDAETWSRIETIFLAALELPEAEQAACVESACGGNEEIRREVLAMLAADRSGVSRIRPGVARMVGDVLASVSPPSIYLPPERIGPYERQQFLGRGGMGAVWKYLRVDTGQPMAVKFLHLNLHDPLYEQLRQRFASEISTLARLRHPNIVSFHDAGALDDGTQWLVMDFVEEFRHGMSFTEYCRQPSSTIQNQLLLFRTVCQAVLYAHHQGVIHRDLKPSNILIAKDSTPRIVDFGIARQLQDISQVEDATGPTGRIMTPGYAPPEWKRHGQVSVATDVYSLGVILYEVLAGRHPYKKSVQTANSRIDSLTDPLDVDSMTKPPQKPSTASGRETTGDRTAQLPRSAWNDLDKLCLKAMNSDVKERYASVESLIRDIDHYLNDEPLEAQPGLFRYRAEKFIRRNRRAVLATAAALVLIISLVSFFMWRLAQERNMALAQAARVQHVQDFTNYLLQGGDRDKMIDRGIEQAGWLSNQPEAQADLYQTLGSVIPLALVGASKDQAKSAEDQVRRSLDEIRHSQPENKALLGNAEMALGTVMIQAGDQKQAADILDRAVKDIEAADGAHSPQLARALGAQSDADIYLGSYDAADSASRQALAIDRSVYGEYHPHVAEDLGNLAQTQETRGYFAQAESLEREALAIMTRWYGPNDSETARKMTTLASTLLSEKKLDEASDLLQRALSIQERVYGPQHPTVAYVLNSMGLVALDQKNFAEAEKDYAQVAQIYRLAYGDQDYRVAVALGNLASVYQQEKLYPQAAKILEDVVQRFTRAMGAENIQTGMAQVRLGRNLLHEEKYSEAKAHSLAGYNILARQMSPESPWVTGAQHDVEAAEAALGHRPSDKQRASAGNTHS